MNIKKPAKAGTMESNDIYIMIKPNEDNGLEIQVESVVMSQFGDQIRNVIIDTLDVLGIENIYLVAKDRGALDYTIRSRVETAVKRGM